MNISSICFVHPILLNPTNAMEYAHSIGSVEIADKAREIARTANSPGVKNNLQNSHQSDGLLDQSIKMKGISLILNITKKDSSKQRAELLESAVQILASQKITNDPSAKMELRASVKEALADCECANYTCIHEKYIRNKVFRNDDDLLIRAKESALKKNNCELIPEIHLLLIEALFNAIVANDLDKVKRLLGKAVPINTRNFERRTAGKVAAELQRTEIAQYIESKIKESSIQLLQAVFASNFNLIEKLLDEGADPNSSICTNSLLQYAVLNKNTSLYSLLLTYGAEDIPNPFLPPCYQQNLTAIKQDLGDLGPRRKLIVSKFTPTTKDCNHINDIRKIAMNWAIQAAIKKKENEDDPLLHNTYDDLQTICSTIAGDYRTNAQFIVAMDVALGEIQAIATTSLVQRHIYLDLLATHPHNIRCSENMTLPARVEGAASKIIESLIEQIKARNISQYIIVQSLSEAKNFYIKQGFVPLEQIDKSINIGVNTEEDDILVYGATK